MGGFPASITGSHTIVSDTNGAVVVNVEGNGSLSPFPTDPTVTFGGNSMTLLNPGGFTSSNNATSVVWCFYIKNTTLTGSQTITATAGANKAQFLCACSTAYTGVDQTNVVDTNTTTGSEPSGSHTLTLTATAVANNDWGVICAGSENTINAGTNSTFRVKADVNAEIFDTNADQAAGSVSMAIGTTDITNAVMFFLKPVATANTNSFFTMFN